MDDTNVNSEMNDLVRQAEEWAKKIESTQDIGLNNVPKISFDELCVQKIGQQILTRAAFLLLEQLGIQNVEEFRKHFGNILNGFEKNQEFENIEKKYDETPVDSENLSTISPMQAEEFKSLLINGWPNDEHSSSSPQGSRRASILADLIPMSPIASEGSSIDIRQLKNDKEIRRSAPLQSFRRPFITSTPIKNDQTRRKSIPDRLTQSSNNLLKTKMLTPNRSNLNMSFTPTPLAGEGPLENRASRLRRLKMEEKLRENGGCDNKKTRNVNSIFSDNLNISFL